MSEPIEFTGREAADARLHYCLEESRSWLSMGRGRHLVLAYIGIERVCPVRLVSSAPQVQPLPK